MSLIFIQKVFNLQIQILRHDMSRLLRQLKPQTKRMTASASGFSVWGTSVRSSSPGGFHSHHHTPLFQQRHHNIIHAVIMEGQIAQFMSPAIFQIKPVFPDAGRIKQVAGLK